MAREAAVYYTRAAFEERAKQLGITVPELHSRRRVVFFYSGDDLERVCADQPPLSWSPIRWLLRIKYGEERERRERQAFEAKCSAKDLKKWVGKPSERRGRPSKRPQTYYAGVALLREQTKQFERSLKQLVLDGETVF